MRSVFNLHSLILGSLFLLPIIALIGFGLYFLWLQDWLYYGIEVISANIALFSLLTTYRNHQKKPLAIKPIEISPNPNWSDDGLDAWSQLDTFAKNYPAKTDLFTNPDKIIKLTNDVLLLVAKHFNSKSKYPILEFPLPYLLKLICLICEDLQREVLDKIPGSHAVQVSDLLLTKEYYDKAKKVTKAKSIVSVGNWLFNWPGAALGKARGLLMEKGFSQIKQEIINRLLSAYISKLGYYAIQLYSGQITLDDIAHTEILSDASIKDVKNIKAYEQSIEPLRILVLGQISSGKSTLINKLFGEIRTAEGVLPTTSQITPFKLEREGLEVATILDSAGYGGLEHDDAPAELKKAWAEIDVVLIVCNASHASRTEDAKQLNKLRLEFQLHRKNRALPVIIAVATQIDKLRPFREWLPPYNIQDPHSVKAQNIREVCEVISQDLNLPLNRIVPVCLAPEKPTYNLDDGLIPLIHELLDDAQRARYLRCLNNQKDKSYWQEWRNQVKNAGQFFVDISDKIA
ncbi:MAG: GTPase [Methylococcales bacterium]